jgi:hypothetical protein
MPIKRPIFRQRIPPAYENIQVNFCKNPKCYNFGIPAIENIKGVPLPESDTGSRNRDNYTIVGGSNLLWPRTANEE